MGFSCSSSGFCNILAIILLLCSGSVFGEGNATDQHALLEIKASITDDPLGILSSWNTSFHFCQWQGVTCGRKHQRVTILDLNSQRLVGCLSPYVGNLSFLQELSLQKNSFSGEIPPQIGHLHRLQILSLWQNLLSGQIPADISGCSKLDTLDLGENKLVGEIPEDFSSLLKLHVFTVEGNNLTGSIPPFFGNFSYLEILAGTGNNFIGSIPDTLGKLSKLNILSLGEGTLSGTIPSSLYNLSTITVFSFTKNLLGGTLPQELGNMFPSLTILELGENQFTGRIPLSLSNASHLEILALPINGFSGNMPSLKKLHKLSLLVISINQLGNGQAGDLNFLSTISNATSLNVLGIDTNNFGGKLPSSITNFTSLRRLTLGSNQITGIIPSALGNLVNLEWVGVEDNRLTGDIPEEIGKHTKLKVLKLDGNNFSGFIPSSFGNLTLLTHLSMERNSLWGSIPPSLGKCQNLLYLSLDQNKLSGAIPKEVMRIPSLAIYFGLSQNHLTGSLPPEVGTLKNLGTLSISDNILSGEIPSSLSRCESLEFLYMQGNFFQGNIPSSLSLLKAIQELDCSHNNLTGNIPEFFAGMKLLQRLNLSFNNFEGEVPMKGIFDNSSAISIEGNSKLCGGITELMLPPCDNKVKKKRRLTLASELVIAASGILCGVLIISALFLMFIKRKRTRSNSSSSLNKPLLMSYQSLLKATDGFSSTSLLGVGSFGSVYKGTLERDGMIIAVKVLNLLHPAASKSFKAECEVLRNVRHRNLVKILTACSGINYEGNDFKALIYEFMVNGSLEEWLHPIHRTNNEAHEPSRSLNFLCRINIAIDVANALEYLHQGCQTPIIHCDLKPSNILLDDKMVAHVGDFGLARFFTEAVHNNSGVQSSSTIGVRGTVGYTAPEYGLGNSVSTYGDVYAYGILLLEIFTAKRPTDEMFKDGMNLHTFAKAALQEQLVEKFLDPIVFQEINGDRSNSDPNSQSWLRNDEVTPCIISILEMGVACSAQLPSERMNISVVATELLAIKKRFLRMRSHGGT